MIKARIQLKMIFMVVFVVVNGTWFVGKGNNTKEVPEYIVTVQMLRSPVNTKLCHFQYVFIENIVFL